MIRRMLRTLSILPWFLAVYARDLVRSNLRLAWDAVTPRDRSTPCFVEIDVDPAPDAAVLAYCNLLSMTPGTLAVDLSPDRRTLVVHAMYLDDPEAFRRDLKRNLERHIRRLAS